MTSTIGLDFEATATKAKGMTTASLRYAIADILRTLPHSDAIDRTDNGDRGGRYRDEAGVYRAELTKRGDRGGLRG